MTKSENTLVQSINVKSNSYVEAYNTKQPQGDPVLCQLAIHQQQKGDFYQEIHAI